MTADPYFRAISPGIWISGRRPRADCRFSSEADVCGSLGAVRVSARLDERSASYDRYAQELLAAHPKPPRPVSPVRVLARTPWTLAGVLAGLAVVGGGAWLLSFEGEPVALALTAAAVAAAGLWLVGFALRYAATRWRALRSGVLASASVRSARSEGDEAPTGDSDRLPILLLLDVDGPAGAFQCELVEPARWALAIQPGDRLRVPVHPREEQCLVALGPNADAR